MAPDARLLLRAEPLIAHDDVFGLIVAARDRVGPYIPEEAEVLFTFANQAEAAIGNARLYDRVTRFNQDLEQRASQLEAANRELEAFSYSVSHDLRAPLRTIDGFSLALLEDFGEQIPDEGRNYLMRIRSAAQRMAQLIDDLLNLSRLTRAPLNPEPTNLSKIALQVLQNLQREARDRLVNISIQPNIMAECDPRLIKVVFENLLSNAWKFTSKQELAHIEFGMLDDPQNGQVFYVRDNGAGFDMAYVNKLFGAFQRLHTTSEFPGIGIGLAIVQRIINRHGGTSVGDCSPTGQRAGLSRRACRFSRVGTGPAR